MSGDVQTLTIEDFASLLGDTADRIPPDCLRLIAALDFRHRVLDADARDATVLGILKTLAADLPTAGRNRLNRWEEGWNENLQALAASDYDTRYLIPGYYRKGTPIIMRLRGRYVMPENPAFETHFLAVLITWMGHRFLRHVDHIYEFGCGPAHNLVALAKLFPEKYLHGLDWAKSSQAIIADLAEKKGLRIAGRHFDMFAPDVTYRIAPNSAVITVGAMEQLGEEWEQFLQYVISQAPTIVVHIEPIYELYDQTTLFDYLAAKYSEKRGYLRGYLPRLHELRALGDIEILHVQKNLGSLYHDGWSTVAWRPRQLPASR